MKSEKTYINNRKARYNYFIIETYHAGLVLTGQEVKSIKAGHVNLTDSYCYFTENELFIRKIQISVDNDPFNLSANNEHKLLLTKKELKSLKKAISVKGYTIIPLSIEIPRKGFIKMNIGLCKGKHNYDKRNSIKERDLDRENKR